MQIILKKPIVSEKSVGLAKTGWYTFLVDPEATKPVIAQAIEGKFNVDVVEVRTITVKSQSKMQRGNRRKYFTTGATKKALIKLKDGQKISLFETEAKAGESESQEVKEPEVKEKKSLLRRTKIKIEKSTSAEATVDEGEK